MAAGYRLAGPELDHVCCRHLYGNDRLLTVWLASDHAVVIAVGPHDRSAGDLYRQLVEGLNIEPPEEERSKPPCCDEAGQPPVDADTTAALVAFAESLARPPRRRRNRQAALAFWFD